MTGHTLILANALGIANSKFFLGWKFRYLENNDFTETFWEKIRVLIYYFRTQSLRQAFISTQTKSFCMATVSEPLRLIIDDALMEFPDLISSQCGCKTGFSCD